MPADAQNRRRAATPPADMIGPVARILPGVVADDKALIAAIGQSRLALIGEASHGTHDFYTERARLTRRLIEELGLNAVAVEADWPDAYRINRYVRVESGDRTPEQALSGFERFPAWMWRNTDVLEFVGWLRKHNQGVSGGSAVGFYQAYGYAASFDLSQSCENVVVQQLMDLQRHAGQHARPDRARAEDEEFFAEQNARLVKNAEAY